MSRACPARDGGALDSDQARSHALAGLRALDRLVVHLDGTHAHLAAPGRQYETVARGDRPRPERPVTTVPIPWT